MKITIPGGFPMMNYMLRSPNFWGLYEAFKSVVCKEVENRYTQITEYPAHLHFDWFRKDGKTDPDNIGAAKKTVIDGLVTAGILTGDGWAQICGLSDAFHINKGNPRVVVSIVSLPASGQ